MPPAGDPYAIVALGKDRMKVVALDTRDVKDLQSLKKTAKEDFIWFRHGGKAYVVNDPAVLAKARDAWAPTERIDTELEKQGAIMNEQGRKMQAIGEQLGRQMTAAFNDDSVRGTERQLNALAVTQDLLARRMDKLSARMDRAETDTQRAAIEREMDTVQTQMETVEKQMAAVEAKLAHAHRKADVDQEPARALHAKMEALSKPMSELGAQMGRLGAEQARLSHEADKATRALLEEALRKGQAMPVGPKQG
jgi:predicted  nucleic acid-binding Zn-ribbon protein